MSREDSWVLFGSFLLISAGLSIPSQAIRFILGVAIAFPVGWFLAKSLWDDWK